MTPPTLTLVANYESSKSAIASIARVSFDGGVEEVAQTEINVVQDEWAIRALLSVEEAELINSFLEEQAGSTPFYWNPHHGYQSTQKLFTCESWSLEYVSERGCNIEVTLKEWFGFSDEDADPAQTLNVESGDAFNLDDGVRLVV